MQQKALLKRMESDKKTKSVPSEDGYRVFHSDSSSEISEKEEQSVSGEGSPSWSPSRWESPHYGPKPGRSSSSHGFQQQQKQAPNESLETSHQQYYLQSASAPRAKHDLPPDKVEALGQNLHRLGVEDNSAPQYTSSPERVHGHGGHHQRHSTMRRPRSEEFLAAQDVERHHAPSHHVQKTVSFNQTVAVAGVNNNKHAVVSSSGDQRSSSLMPPNDVQHHGGSRVSPSVSPLVKGEAGLHVENLQLSGNFDGRSSQHTANGLECQQDLYAAGDIQDYGVSDYASTVGDGDSYQAMVLESHSRPSSGELDSYVVLDHRVTRPGSYQRSSSAGRSAALSHGYNNYGAENHDSHQFDGEKSARHQQLEWLQIGASQSVSRVQQRPPQTSSYHMQQQQPSHVSFQGFSQSPPQPSHLRPPAGQNGHLVHESHLQGGVTKSGMYPFLPRGDEAPYVNCQQCGQLLSVPSNLPPTKKAYQKLRCGACMKISVFLLVSDDQISALPHSPRRSGVNADFPRNCSPPDSASNGRHAPPSSRAEVDMVLDRGHPPISSGGSQRLPPTARNIPRGPSGSKLSAMGSAAANGTTNMAQGSVAANGSLNQNPVPNGVSNQYPVSNGVSIQQSAANGSSNLHQVAGPTAIRNPHVTHFSEGMSARPAHTSSGVNGESPVHHVLPRGSSSSDTEGHHVPDGRFPQTSSESENDSPRQRVSQMPAMNSIQNEQFYASSAMTQDHSATQQYSKDAGYSEEGNSTPKSLKSIMKKSSKDLTKTKQASSTNQYRRKVIVNGKIVPDVLVKRAEGLAGPIHPGSYWYVPLPFVYLCCGDHRYLYRSWRSYVQYCLENALCLLAFNPDAGMILKLASGGSLVNHAWASFQ